MDVVSGTDTSTPSAGVDRLLAGIRRLTALTDSATDAEAILRALSGELLSVPGAEEVHIHHLLPAGADEDLVTVYMFGAEGRVGYLVPRSERPPGVSWVASTGQSFLAADSAEFAASVPRLSATGDVSCALLLPLAERGEVEAVVMLVRRLAAVFAGDDVELAAALV